jgi:cellulose synthase A
MNCGNLFQINCFCSILAGSPRVPGDEDGDDVDDVHNDYDIDYDNHEKQQIAEAMLHGHMSYGRGDDHDMPRTVQTIEPQTPLFTSGPQV